MLDRTARARLRTLSKNNADLVARHLVMAGRLIDADPATAYEHAQAAMRRAGRVDVVREALAVTAYATGNYAEALRELRTVRRLSGIDAHRPMEADCERGLGRPERALAVVADSDPASLSEHDRVELAIVASGARADLGETEAGLHVLESSLVGKITRPELQRRLDLVRAERLEELGRTEEAGALREAAGPEPEPDEEIVVLDLADDFPQAERPVQPESAPHEGHDSQADTAQVADERPQDGEPTDDTPDESGVGSANADDGVADADDGVADAGDGEAEDVETDVSTEADTRSPEQAEAAEAEDAVTVADSGGAAEEAAGTAGAEAAGDLPGDVPDATTASADEADVQEPDPFEQAELDLDVSDKERE
ncbi:hypothetical protein KZX45_16500 [Georgenia sp. EYE_87]|uniref:hypothetical protein n=1 Tax=Georgenia sp. EYE_87 TaxID=2853448 RepID=UPI002006CBDE|nr:hypothetical protein [Georgenia sp. EYE_87]MCK6212144.1 hypothetical protein [Georgenia sp. EYE_87]